MPAITRLNDPDVIFNVLSSVKDAVNQAWTDCGYALPDRSFVGFCDPPNTCCPDIAIWGNNLRPDDLGLGQGLTRGYYTCTNTWALDVHIRWSDCFLDIDDQGRELPPIKLEAMSRALYAKWHCMYMSFMCRANGGLISELGDCDKFNVTALQCFSQGGCAGAEFTMTVTLDQ
jgi:hypothetical protein